MQRHTMCIELLDTKWQMHNVQHADMQHCKHTTREQVTTAFQSCEMLLYRSWMMINHQWSAMKMGCYLAVVACSEEPLKSIHLIKWQLHNVLLWVVTW